MQLSLVIVFASPLLTRVGQNHTYTVYLRCFWQGDHQIYGHVRCIYTVLAKPKHVSKSASGVHSRPLPPCVSIKHDHHWCASVKRDKISAPVERKDVGVLPPNEILTVRKRQSRSENFAPVLPR